MVIRSQLEKSGYSLETGYPKHRLTVNFPSMHSVLKLLMVCWQQVAVTSRSDGVVHRTHDSARRGASFDENCIKTERPVKSTKSN